MRISDWSSDVCSSDLNGQFALDNPPLRFVRPVLRPGAQNLQQFAVTARHQFGPDAEKRRNQCCPQHSAPMIVDLVLEARHAGRVGARLAIEPDRPATGKDEPVPRKKYSALPEIG